jgi:broad specificity phosphatase PhoE
MARGLILVRHALPEVVPGVAAKLWRLGEAAKEDCVLLAHALPANLGPQVVSSGSPKADETAAVIALRRGLTVITDPRLAEVDQGGAWFDGDYREIAAAYLAGRGPDHWEPREAVAARFSAAVEAAIAQPGDGDVVVVNHGLALSVYLAGFGPAVRGDDGTDGRFELVPFWRSLTFPDAWRLDFEAGAIRRLYFSGLPPE